MTAILCMAFAVLGMACSEDEPFEKIDAVGVGLFDFSNVVLNETHTAHYSVPPTDSVVVTMYLCGPVDESYPHYQAFFRPSRLDTLLRNTNARVMNGRCTFKKDKSGGCYYSWLPTPDLVEVGKCYLWVVDVRFVDSEIYADDYEVMGFKVKPPKEEEDGGMAGE